MFSTQLLGYFSVVDQKEFDELKDMEVAELEKNQKLIAEDIETLEAWLGEPPATATGEEMWLKIGEWDEARQWYFAMLDAINWRQSVDGQRYARIQEIKVTLRQMQRAVDDTDDESIENQMDPLREELENLERAAVIA
jgi:hypothetical protein